MSAFPSTTSRRRRRSTRFVRTLHLFVRPPSSLAARLTRRSSFSIFCRTPRRSTRGATPPRRSTLPRTTTSARTTNSSSPSRNAVSPGLPCCLDPSASDTDLDLPADLLSSPPPAHRLQSSFASRLTSRIGLALTSVAGSRSSLSSHLPLRLLIPFTLSSRALVGIHEEARRRGQSFLLPPFFPLRYPSPMLIPPPGVFLMFVTAQVGGEAQVGRGAPRGPQGVEGPQGGALRGGGRQGQEVEGRSHFAIASLYQASP